jgi:4-diphosphocytidyl-2-C-methyl-D-erythritol kinase
MKKILRIKSPAKINLGLRILSKRRDGFHNIESIFIPVKIYDSISLAIKKLNSSQNSIVFSSNMKDIDNKNNLCVKAINNFLNEFKIIKGYQFIIKLNKKIPIGAGLGGGSSDAASIIILLKKYFRKFIKTDKKIFTKKIYKIASTTGSDVPFFLTGKPSYVTSKGEKIIQLRNFELDHPILIVNPGINISTKWAYDNLKIKINKIAIWKKINKFQPGIFNILVNDFEEVVFNKYPKIEKIKKQLYNSGAIFSLMSGSGSTVYGIFDDTKKCKLAENYFRKMNYTTF